MAGSLLDLVTAVQSHPIPQDAVEEAAKIAVILPVLDRLGWDWSDHREVVPEYGVSTQRVDFCLRLAGTARVFIEAKRPSEDLEGHQEQLLNYSFLEGVDVAVLTNGLLWWLYLPKANGSWEQRKFFTIDMRQQEATAIAEHFTTFLSRSAVATGTAIQAANAVLDGAKREKTIIEALPLAWARLLGGPDELLVDLIAEAVESQCGYRPDSDTIATFLARRLTTPPPAAPNTQTALPPTPPTGHFEPVMASTGYTGRLPVAFTLFGERHAVKTWKQVLLGTAALLYQRHPTEFEAVLTLGGRKRSYFATSPNPLFEPAQIEGSPYFAETNLSANDIWKRCCQLLALFNHPETALTIETV